MKSGIFTISLDFELHWGIFDKSDIQDKIKYFDNTLECIPNILKLFVDYNVNVTWATVGMLFLEDEQQWRQNIPIEQPNYENVKLSAYNLVKNNPSILTKSKYHFSPKLIELINKTKGQEVSSHTYSHYYCLELGQTLNQFNYDLKKNIELAKGKNIKISSLVFPRNQFNKDYLDTCLENGVVCVRVNPKHWFWNVTTKKPLINKIFRTLDCYINLSKNSYRLEDVKFFKNKLLLLPSSRFLKPYNKINLLNTLRLKRIKAEMSRAAKKGEVYHLWWHPHNFGNYTEQSLKDLKSILNHYSFLKEKYNMRSLNMTQTYNSLINEKQ